jgi:hypothetical protein
MGDIKTYNIENITNAQFVIQSLDYQELVQAIEKQQKRVERLQKVGDTEGALEESAELETLEKRLVAFKENVIQLYETFNKITINTERLAQAKAYFDKGQFREADAILNAEDMAHDLERLLAREQQLDQEKADIAQGKAQLADEYVIKARLQTVAYDQPHWFEQACAYFDAALTATPAPTPRFEYALFLQNHNSFDRSKPLYAALLLEYRALAEDNPRTYLPDVAMTLINVSIFYLQAQPDQERSIALATEALNILVNFQNVPAFERYVFTAKQVLQANGVDVTSASEPSA